jgi:MFS family permease
LLPLFARDLGAGPSLIGFVMGASTLTGIFVKLPAGAWSDIVGRRPLLIFGALVFATLPFTYLGVSTLAALILLRFMHGSATAIFGPVAFAGLSEIAPPSKRGAWLSTYSTAQGAGQALGPIPAGYLIAAGRFDLAFLAAGESALRLSELSVGVFLDAFNIFNSNAATQITMSTGSSFLRPTNILAPRVFRIGVKFAF